MDLDDKAAMVAKYLKKNATSIPTKTIIEFEDSPPKPTKHDSCPVPTDPPREGAVAVAKKLEEKGGGKFVRIALFPNAMVIKMVKDNQDKLVPSPSKDETLLKFLKLVRIV